MSTTVTAQEFLAKSIELATANVLNSGGPFGAVIVTADGQAFDGVNRVTATNDPTAHAEVTAIRRACSELGTFDLTGATLYTSCEPCPMCLGAIYWARPRAVFFSATRQDAAAAGFDDAFVYDELALPPSARTLPMRRVVHPAAAGPFAAWAAKPDRVEY